MRSVQLLTGAVSGGISDQWFVSTDEGAVGPVSIELLARGIETGKVPLDCLVRNESWTVWCPLSDIALVKVAPPIPLPAPPQLPAPLPPPRAPALHPRAAAPIPPVPRFAAGATTLPPPPSPDTEDGSDGSDSSDSSLERAFDGTFDEFGDEPWSEGIASDARPTLPHIPAWMAASRPPDSGRDSRPTLPRMSRLYRP